MMGRVGTTKTERRRGEAAGAVDEAGGRTRRQTRAGTSDVLAMAMAVRAKVTGAEGGGTS